MRTANSNDLKSSNGDKVKYNENLELLKAYVRQSPYIPKLEQPTVSVQFGVPYSPMVFREEYSSRIKRFLYDNTSTAAYVSKITSIPQKYICQVKALLEDKGDLKVVGFGRCPATGSANVQFLSTNPEIWDDPDLVSRNELKMR
tara:strand:- start:4451 stop:4882 length:432 start_codon:yes stop_codon:yes gene_type:complete